jgi:drug/metabolite transporter (DMT)-like permease
MGEALALGSALVWALTTIAMRPIAGHALLNASLVRMLVGSGILLAYAWPTGAIERALAAPASGWLWLAGSTLSSLVVGDSLYFAASARIGVARAMPIASAFPLFGTTGAVLLRGEPATVSLVLGTVLVVLGVGVIVAQRPSGGGPRIKRGDYLGFGFAGLAALGWASSGLQLDVAVDVLDPLSANLIRFPLATAIFAALYLVRRPGWRVSGSWRWLAIASGVGTVGAALLFVGAIHATGAAQAIALNATSPVFGSVLAAWLLHEKVPPQSMLGIASCVLGSVLLVGP